MIYITQKARYGSIRFHVRDVSYVPISRYVYIVKQGGHGTGKTGNLILDFSRQGKHRKFSCNTGKIFETQGKKF